MNIYEWGTIQDSECVWRNQYLRIRNESIFRNEEKSNIYKNDTNQNCECLRTNQSLRMRNESSLWMLKNDSTCMNQERFDIYE